MVCKVSEYTSWSAMLFEKIIHEALRVNGHSTDLVQIITGLGDAGAALVQCSLIDKIIFTGSPAVGRKVMEGASKVLKPVVLELGGKDPMVFCEDVNIKVPFFSTSECQISCTIIDQFTNIVSSVPPSYRLYAYHERM